MTTFTILHQRSARISHDLKHGRSCFFACGVVVDERVLLGEYVRIYNNSVIRNNVFLDDHVTIGHLVVVEADVSIGAFTTVQSQCHITKGTCIGEKVFLGPGVITTNEKNIAAHGRTEQKLEGPIIQRAARIGAGSLIMPGVTIGENAFVGAGSIVTHDIPAGELWVGSPARFVRKIPKEELLCPHAIKTVI